MSRVFLRLGFAAVAALLSSESLAQTYPAKPVRVIVKWGKVARDIGFNPR
jgi:tripartite-type tricarboxylate transporter receptor subunit TctC